MTPAGFSLYLAYRAVAGGPTWDELTAEQQAGWAAADDYARDFYMPLLPMGEEPTV